MQQLKDALSQLPQMEEGATPSKGFGAIFDMDHTGDSRHMWDKTDEKEVGIAKLAFEAARLAGKTVYSATVEVDDLNFSINNGNLKVNSGKPKFVRGAVLAAFDPNVEIMVFATALAGG